MKLVRIYCGLVGFDLESSDPKLRFSVMKVAEERTEDLRSRTNLLKDSLCFYRVMNFSIEATVI